MIFAISTDSGLMNVIRMIDIPGTWSGIYHTSATGLVFVSHILSWLHREILNELHQRLKGSKTAEYLLDIKCLPDMKSCSDGIVT